MRFVLGSVLLIVGAIGIVSAAPAKVMPGAVVFQSSGCTQCHGVTGRGTEKGPSLFGVGRRLERDEIERQIREGGGAMPAFGEVLSAEEIDQLGEYLETWKTAATSKKKRSR